MHNFMVALEIIEPQLVKLRQRLEIQAPDFRQHPAAELFHEIIPGRGGRLFFAIQFQQCRDSIFFTAPSLPHQW
ncbi:MAG: hypothetical protein K8R48_01045 [Alphaproteobacteria bacterium]|nr:hypothetical protein [Alphaproteobacteria bacterium]